MICTSLGVFNASGLPFLHICTNHCKGFEDCNAIITEPLSTDAGIGDLESSNQVGGA